MDTNSFEEIREPMLSAFRLIEDLYVDNCDKYKVLTGYEEIDHLIAGLHCGDLIALVGSPGSGKTTFLVNIAMNIALRAQQEVAFAGMQHTPEQLGMRFLGKESNVIMREILRGYIRKEDWHELTSKASKIAESPLTIFDLSVQGVDHLIAGLRRLKQEKPGTKLLIIDSLDMLPVRNRQEYAEYLRLLKLAALEMKLPILLSCCLKTKKLKKTNKVVIKDSKLDIVERFSDTIMLIDIDNDNIDARITPDGLHLRNEFDDGVHFLTKLRTEIYLLKNLYGPTGSIFLNYIPQQFRFESTDPQEDEE